MNAHRPHRPSAPRSPTHLPVLPVLPVLSVLSVLALLTGLTGLAVPLAAQQHRHERGDASVGTVHFPTSCSAGAQARLDRAVAMLHSFWFEAAEGEFAGAAEEDPGCAMAHWGTAMTLWGNPMTRAAPAPERVRAALDALGRAEVSLASATPRERAYVEAAATLYRDHEEVGHLERMRRHEEAMKAVAEAHPEDPEARIFLGRIMVANASPDDLDFERQKRAAALMEPIFAEQPDHPGLAHYIIHAFDAPPVAEQGLEAARRYAAIAPAAPHALHMPSHIFTRLGLWDESIETNARSARAEPDPDAAVHPLDYMVYAYLQQGRDGEAGDVVARAVRSTGDRFYGGLIGYNAVAIPARFALERERWSEAAALPVPEGALPYVEAVTRFARAIGAARSGDAGAARSDAARLGELERELEARGEGEWSIRVQAQRLAAEAWAAWAEGDAAGARELGRRAADVEETVEKHPVTPGPLLPARELYGDLLRVIGDPAGAQGQYEATLAREPRRARALHGATRAALEAGEHAAARAHAAELLEVMEKADPDRPEPGWARQVVRGG